MQRSRVSSFGDVDHPPSSEPPAANLTGAMEMAPRQMRTGARISFDMGPPWAVVRHSLGQGILFSVGVPVYQDGEKGLTSPSIDWANAAPGTRRSKRWTESHPKAAGGLQSVPPTQLVELLAASRTCTDTDQFRRESLPESARPKRETCFALAFFVCYSRALAGC